MGLEVVRGDTFDGRLTFTPRYPESTFDINRVQPICNTNFFKPQGGFWTSVDNGWEDWCRETMPMWLSKTTFDVTLTDTSNVLVLHDMDTVNSLPQLGLQDKKGRPYLNFEALSEKYDAIFIDLTHGDSDFNRRFKDWAADSIVVLNSDSIDTVTNSKTGAVVYSRDNSANMAKPFEVDSRLLSGFTNDKSLNFEYGLS